jgi:plastocyanin
LKFPLCKLCVAAALLLSGVAPAAADDLKLLVLDSTGKPAAGVVVLVDAQRLGQAGSTRQPLEIRQKNLRFSPALGVVPVGGEVVFTNEDDFDHHVMGRSQGTRFEFVVPAAGGTPPKSKAAKRVVPKTVLTKAGVVEVSCHLHASMHADIVVTEAPFHGLTDAAGEISFTGLKAGRASITTWHPLMLTPADAVVVQVGGPANTATVRLNHEVRAKRR